MGRSNDDKRAFRSLTRGYTHWASGRLEQIDVNIKNPDYCHVRCVMKPSMKQGNYHTYLLLGSNGGLANVEKASCECAAGYDLIVEMIYSLLW